MTTTPLKPEDDPLAAALPDRVLPDRVFYATGVLLDAADFQAEQLYHRSRLARSLAYLHGCGTIAGLKVQPHGSDRPETDDLVITLTVGETETLEIAVQPGLAIDRLGRLIEVPRTSCIRLDRWFEQQRSQTALASALHGNPINGVVVDVFLRFVVSEQGKTPAFAYGAFDALDAVTPARLRDGYRLDLVIRKPSDSPLLPLPIDPWAELATVAASDRREALHKLMLKAWRAQPLPDQPLPEYVAGQDRTSVFLARLTLSATAGADGLPVWNGKTVTVDNRDRRFVYSAGALINWIGS